MRKAQHLLETTFRQALLQTVQADIQLLISKKGKVKRIEHPPTKSKIHTSHNRRKNYILAEGTPVPFLIELGVMTPEGKVKKQKYDKFKQINRFMEMIRDVVPQLSSKRTIHIVDFGCGKSYLTFALYYYLTQIEKRDIRVTGLDLKKDVIQHCQALAQSFGYDKLTFQVGDITDYHQHEPVDMVVTLHACDTATDAALEKAVRWEADVILSVPCCQHELLPQIESDVLEPLLKHGLLKERFSSLATDAIRAQLLELMGYKVQMLEFIDMEHTPKNILIRALRTQAQDQKHLVRQYISLKQFLHVDPYLENTLRDRLDPLFAEVGCL